MPEPSPDCRGSRRRTCSHEDYAALDAKTMLRCTAEVEELILMQSIEGHAHEGHGLFHGRTISQHDHR